MDAKSGPEPRFSDDGQWWWDGTRWVPANEAVQRVQRPLPRWALRLVDSNRARWRWVILIALVAAVAVAAYDLVSGWEVPTSGLADVMTIVLLAVGIVSCVALLVFSGDERRTMAGNANSLEVVGVAARGVRWSCLLAIGLSVLFFANCSAGVTSGDLSTGATAHPSQFWPLAALVMLPLVAAFAVPAVLAMGASRLANQGRLSGARRIAFTGMWSAALLAVVALVTAGIAFFGGVSQCFLGSTASACAAGVGGLMNPTAIASLIVIFPYLTLMRTALSAASSRPDG